MMNGVTLDYLNRQPVGFKKWPGKAMNDDGSAERWADGGREGRSEGRRL